ncbi:hypothetical protein [Agrobacterium pusense]|uniref:hypothetical protein n=1 Tax=Agrobacterium pusense TaxID=648995 RepID=UPI00156BACA6|nr:hypothetical protein [Agrobacterium pusense]QKJ94369.1 hypothetical protein HQN82_23315 [Agrobacterium pusense]
MAMTDKKGGSRKRTERRGNLITGYAGKWEPLFEKKAAARATAARVLSGVSEGVKRAKNTGGTVRVTYVIRSSDEEPEIEIEEITPQKDALDTALAAAKQRGSERVAEILKRPEMLSADEFADEIGSTRETVNKKRKRHEVLGLEGAKRGVRFPKWQIGDDGQLLGGLAQLFEALNGHPWAVYRFLLQESGSLGGRTGLEMLRAGRIEDAVGAARSIGKGDFS